MTIEVNPGDKVLIRVFCYTGTFQVSINNLYYDTPLTNTLIPTVDAVAAVFDTAIQVAYKNVLSSDATYLGVDCRVFRLPPNPNPALSRRDHVGPGTGGMGLLPTQCAPVVSFKSRVAGRRGGARIYLPFPSVAAFDADGTPSAGYLASAGVLAGIIAGGFAVAIGGNSASFVPCIYGPPLDPARVPPPNPPRLTPTFTPITSYIVRDKCGTQRRRGTYGRTNSLPF